MQFWSGLCVVNRMIGALGGRDLALFHVKHLEVRGVLEKNRTGRGRHRFKRFIAAVVALAVLGCLGWMFLSAMTVHLKRRTVQLPDLPAAFSGTRILYLTDFRLHGLNGLAATDSLLAQLQGVRPDLLILGGNYVDSGAISLESLFSRFAAFPTNLGICAVAGANDDLAALKAACEHSGITLLNNSGVPLQKDGASLYILGLAPMTGDLDAAASYVRSGQCVIAVANDPGCIPRLNTAEAADGGRWLDLCLCGHNLGGQMVVAGRTLLTLSEHQRRYLSGWILDSIPILISQGLGCQWLNLRLNTEAEAWLITLEP